MPTVNSADGTPIVYDRVGDGPTLVLVGGLLATRAGLRPLAEALAQGFAVVTYDRRGRGDSGDTPPYLIERELEDLAALIEAVGGPAHLYGHSAGAALVVRAAGHQLELGRLVLHEPPYVPDEESHRAEARSYAAELQPLLVEGRYAEAVALTLRRAAGQGVGVRLPRAGSMPDLVEPAPDELLAPSIGYDSAVVGDAQGATVPIGLAADIAQPTLVLAGAESPQWMRDTARLLADTIPAGRLEVLPGPGHTVPVETLLAFLR